MARWQLALRQSTSWQRALRQAACSQVVGNDLTDKDEAVAGLSAARYRAIWSVRAGAFTVQELPMTMGLRPTCEHAAGEADGRGDIEQPIHLTLLHSLF